MPIDPDQSVDDVMQRWPETIRVFLDWRMHCVGCPIARFHSVTTACLEHAADQAAFIAALEEAITRKASQPEQPACADHG
jgi:hybrid cluster-associated redox disulfide protein